MSFIAEKAEEYSAGVEEESAEVIQEFADQLRTSAKDDRKAVREVQLELSYGEPDEEKLIEEAVLATLRWVGVY